MKVTAEMFKQIQDYAYAHYTEGWDVLVECWSIEDAQQIADRDAVTDYDSLFAAVKESVELYNDYQTDIQNA